MVNTELRQENEHLQFVYKKLLEAEKELSITLERNKSEGISVLKDMSGDESLNFDTISDNLDTFAILEVKNREIDQMNFKMKTAEILLKKVKYLLQSPYFGKVDVDFLDEEPVESFYIGINSFSDEDRVNLVYDWRSPIAELFYNNTLGSSFYLANKQRIDVSIEGRRQFIIEKNRLLKFFDTLIAIQDDVLLDALEQDSTKQMQDITATIQKEQNVIIRDTKSSIILVNGVAGSGKTSAIMQRIAYLLYSLRKEITSDNVLILSPNHNFIQYISNVLPSLGEKNPLNMTLLQFVEQYINVPMETEDEYFSRISTAKINEQPSILRSAQFVDFIKKSDELLVSESSLIRDLTHKGKVILSKEKIAKIYQSTSAYSSMMDKMQVTKKKLSDYWENRLIKQAKSPNTQNQILSLSEKQQLNYFGELISDDSEESVIKYGEKLLRKKYQKITKGIEQNNWIDLPQIFDILYSHYQKEPYIHSQHALNLDEAVIYLTIIHTFVEKMTLSSMRFVLIDEVQDYTPAQVSLLSDFFIRSEFTLVGDENQAIFNSSITFQEIADNFEKKYKKVQRYDLLNSYRSSGAITEVFSQLVASDKKIEIVPVRPQGNEVKVYEVSDREAFKQLLTQLWVDLDEKQLTIITKTEDEAKKLSEYLTGDIQSVVAVQVLPISLSKGLEFDNVLIFDVSEGNYFSERDRRILYTAVSRGMQNLFITYKGELSKFIKV